jgi:3',5'-cyclic AMP phosphodiesterase CpdA
MRSHLVNRCVVRFIDRAAIAVATIACLLVMSPISPAHENGHEEGHEHHHVAPAKPSEVYAPGRLPDRVVLTWTSDPATSQAVTWRTSTEVKHGLAEITVASADPRFTENTEKIDASTQTLTTNLNTANFHTAVFQELQPATKYAYRVGDGVNWSEWFHFTTASDAPRPFSFIYFGDAQNNLRSMWSRVIREAYSDAPKASFFLHAGDLVNRAESDAEWGEWFGAGGFLNAMTPSIAVPGNHEQARGDNGTRRLSHHWRPSFAFPENGPPGLEESCYTLVYQDVRIIALNSNEQLERQAEWLDEVLTNNQARWTVCTFHHPVFSTGRGRDNEKLRKLWKPIFDKHRVDLALQGHDHTYGRTGLKTPIIGVDQNLESGVNRRDLKSGTVFVVSVSGPKMYSLQKHVFMKRQLANTQLYQIIHVDGDRLRYEARTAVGDLYDAFTLVKQPGKINRLIESEFSQQGEPR